jgi:threonine dehydrogenase-like Zn-dependent dehydrogenase
MKVFAMLEKGKTGVIEKPDITIKNPTDVIIKTTAVAPYTSDVHLVGHDSFPGMFGNFIGNEAVGIISEAGASVKDFKTGGRVAICGINPDWGSMESQAGISNATPGCVRTSNPEAQGTCHDLRSQRAMKIEATLFP